MSFIQGRKLCSFYSLCFRKSLKVLRDCSSTDLCALMMPRRRLVVMPLITAKHPLGLPVRVVFLCVQCTQHTVNEESLIDR